MRTATHRHEPEEVCPAGLALYARALQAGRIPAAEADRLPCVVEGGLLQPDADDQLWLLPAAPSVALPRLLCAVEDDIARRRRHEAWLAEAFAPLLMLDTPDGAATTAFGIRVLSGLERINTAIGEAMATAAGELLTIQPGGKRPASALEVALPRDRAVLARGCRMRTLYQHTTRHDPAVLAYYERLSGDAEVRTLDELPERLIVVDRAVAFVPASKDRGLALEIRNPALVEYLVTVFERLWRLATPMHPQAAPQPVRDGITARQRAIAGLLIEGHTDAVIAERLGMNIRTAREHIAKLAATLGSESRAQLGYLIGRSGILGPER
ncbi:helix-turn-helix transcriptional regulator [Streptomyces sp. NPDC001595]|uniref:helix-turn-helix transcriptional regulator n=1 Tax=Streptomyces sp. NPDC001532 TaxID=3154520 RepID=UPI0033321D28